MYSSVPPPEAHKASVRPESCTVASENEADCSKPDNVANKQWKKFQELKSRRVRECGRSEEQRKATLKNKALRTVSMELSELDKHLLAEDGVTVPDLGFPRKRKRTHPLPGSSHGGQLWLEAREAKSEESERKWNDVKLYLDPNPQLKGWDKGKYAEKTQLEEKMDSLIEKGHFQEAAELSDRLSQRDFASKLATAFDCQEYAKKKKIDDEQRKAKKKKSNSMFPPKQKWECKGNM